MPKNRNKKQKANKQPTWKDTPTPKKRAKSSESIENIGEQTVLWSFLAFDHEFVWDDINSSADSFVGIAQRVKAHEGLTWSQIIKKSKSHKIPRYKIIPEAQTRLVAISQDDIDELWSFRFGATNRLWGIQQGRVFKAIWWDPQHQIYPVSKKNT